MTNIKKNSSPTPKKAETVFKFMSQEIVSLKRDQKFNTAHNYRSTLNSFSRFLEGREISLDEMTSSLVERYEAWLYGQDLVGNTVSFYLRTLRAAYNKAVERGLVAQASPFRNVRTVVERTAKRAVKEEVVSRIQRADLSAGKSLALARDLFLFCYVMRGMSFIDVVFLRKMDIRGNRLRYRRRKTGQCLDVRLERLALEILARYRETNGDSPYLFPFLGHATGERAYRLYQSLLRSYNRNLVRLSEVLGLETRLTSYVARHSWATAAHDHGAPLALISAAMGHTSERTTEIYVRSLDGGPIDKINREIVDRLRSAVSS